VHVHGEEGWNIPGVVETARAAGRATLQTNTALDVERCAEAYRAG
jgi:hypothetical protein